MGILSNKLIAISLAATVGAVSIGSIAYGLPQNSTNHQTIQRNIKLYSNRTQANETSKSFISLMQPYVYIQNGQYEIKSSIYQNKNISSSEISKLKSMLSRANEIAIKSHTQNELSVANGTQVLAKQHLNNNPNNDSFVAVVGQTKIVYFWWGVYVYLNNVDTMWMEGITTAAACTALSVLFPGIGGIVAGGIASIVATGCGIYSPLVEDGCVISYNYIEGPQQIWAQ